MHARRAATGWKRLRGGAAGLVAGALAIAAIAMGCASGGQSGSFTGGSTSWTPDAGIDVGPGPKSGSSGSGSGVSDSDGGGVEPGSDAGEHDAAPPPSLEAGASVTCNPIAAGTSTLVVNGTTRSFEVQLPADTSNMALLFLWHGWQQQPTTFMNTIVYDVPSGQWVPFDPNAFHMPLMIVAPYDTKMLPPLGLDWDIVSGAVDFPFFEAMLQCIEQRFSIDTTRIYSFGFSAGAVFTDLLSAKYPHLFAATISESGVWFNDPPEEQLVLGGFPLMQWKWPPFVPSDRGNVLLTHGGPNDQITGIISLEQASQDALPFLYDNRRTVMECAHTFGHTLDPDLTQSMYYEYMWDHVLGGPPLSGMIPDFPTPASPVGATTCTFHPAP
jgi:predicted esterase